MFASMCQEIKIMLNAKWNNNEMWLRIKFICVKDYQTILRVKKWHYNIFLLHVPNICIYIYIYIYIKNYNTYLFINYIYLNII